MSTKLGKKSYLLSICLFYLYSFIPCLAQENCRWENVGAHEQMPLRNIIKQPLAKDYNYNFSADIALIDRKGHLYLQLYIQIDDITAGEFYGQVPSGAELEFLPIKGNKKLQLTTDAGASFKIDTTASKVTYNIVYNLNKKSVHYLMNTEINTIKILWTEGLKEYEIYDVDIFKRLMYCIKTI